MTKAKSNTCCQSLGDLISPRFFKALCDPNRVTILSRLAEGCAPQTVSQVAQCCPVDISTVSRHLALLRDAGILEARRQGKEVYYSVSTANLVRTLRSIADAIEACCPDDICQIHQSSETTPKETNQ